MNKVILGFAFFPLSIIFIGYGLFVGSVIQDIWLGNPSKCLSLYAYVRIGQERRFGRNSEQALWGRFSLEYPKEAYESDFQSYKAWRKRISK